MRFKAHLCSVAVCVLNPGMYFNQNRYSLVNASNNINRDIELTYHTVEMDNILTRYVFMGIGEREVLQNTLWWI